MKKINFLSGTAGHDKPQLVLSIFVSLIFITSPLTGLLNPDRLPSTAEKHYHENPQGNITFFMLLPEKNSFEDTIPGNHATVEIEELCIDTLPEFSPIYKNVNVVIW